MATRNVLNVALVSQRFQKRYWTWMSWFIDFEMLGTAIQRQLPTELIARPHQEITVTRKMLTPETCFVLYK